MRGGRPRYSFGGAFASDVAGLRRQSAPNERRHRRHTRAGWRSTTRWDPRTSWALRGSTTRSTPRRSSRCSFPSSIRRRTLFARLSSRCALQAYANWELCLADDASSAPHVATVLHEYAALDRRIRVVRRAHNGGISEASNSALELARGTLVALLDHDDLLRPHSLLLSVLPFLEDSRVGFVYSDADRVDVDGRRISHYFKPDWSPTLLLARTTSATCPLIRTISSRRRRLSEGVRRQSGLGSRAEGHRAPAARGRRHVPHVLYHWRAIAGSVASGGARGEAVRRRRGETGGRGAPRHASAARVRPPRR